MKLLCNHFIWKSNKLEDLLKIYRNEPKLNGFRHNSSQKCVYLVLMSCWRELLFHYEIHKLHIVNIFTLFNHWDIKKIFFFVLIHRCALKISLIAPKSSLSIFIQNLKVMRVNSRFIAKLLQVNWYFNETKSLINFISLAIWNICTVYHSLNSKWKDTRFNLLCKK